MLTLVTTGLAITYDSMRPAIAYALTYAALVAAGGAITRWAWRRATNPG